MSQRKAWTAAQDRALREIYEKRGITKWAEISRILHKQFKIENRSGKQCRERYHNHLDSSIKRQQWSSAEEVQLVQLQQQLGNRWAEISRSIPGRSQNCVKNKFYSILRRGLRKINSIIKSRLKRYKQLEINILFKIVQNSENSDNSKAQSNTLSLKKQIAFYAIDDQENQAFDLKKVKEVVQRIKEFCKTEIKKKALATKKEPEDKQSEEIQSSEYRDDVPVQKQEIKELKPRRNSLYTFHLEKDEVKNDEEGFQIRSGCNSPSLIPQNSLLLKKTSLSNVSLEGISPRCEVISPKSYDIFATEGQLQHNDNSFKSPSIGLINQSPYFDQLRPNLFSSWYNFYPH